MRSDWVLASARRLDVWMVEDVPLGKCINAQVKNARRAKRESHPLECDRRDLSRGRRRFSSTPVPIRDTLRFARDAEFCSYSGHFRRDVFARTREIYVDTPAFTKWRSL